MLVGQNEEGTLAASISHVPSAMETTARAHYDLSQQLRRSLEAPLAAFLKDQEEKRRAVWNKKSRDREHDSTKYGIL